MLTMATPLSSASGSRQTPQSPKLQLGLFRPKSVLFSSELLLVSSHRTVQVVFASERRVLRWKAFEMHRSARMTSYL